MDLGPAPSGGSLPVLRGPAGLGSAGSSILKDARWRCPLLTGVHAGLLFLSPTVAKRVLKNNRSGNGCHCLGVLCLALGQSLGVFFEVWVTLD